MRVVRTTGASTRFDTIRRRYPGLTIWHHGRIPLACAAIPLNPQPKRMRVSRPDQAALQHRQALRNRADAYPMIRIAAVGAEYAEPFFSSFFPAREGPEQRRIAGIRRAAAHFVRAACEDRRNASEIFNGRMAHLFNARGAPRPCSAEKRPRLAPGPSPYHFTSYRKIRT